MNKLVSIAAFSLFSNCVSSCFRDITSMRRLVRSTMFREIYELPDELRAQK